MLKVLLIGGSPTAGPSACAPVMLTGPGGATPLRR